MGKHSFIYCNKCQDFFLSWSYDFGDSKKACPSCFTKNIRYFSVDTFSEMAQIERIYKIKKIINIP